MDTKEADEFFKVKRMGEVNKLMAVGFTEEQAEVLLDMMQTKAMGGGFF